MSEGYTTDFEFHGETFVAPLEPIEFRLVSEDYINSREVVTTRQTDHAQHTPLPAPWSRTSQWIYAATERPFGELFEPTISGAKVDITPEVKPSPLQDMNPYNLYHVNTLRVEALPWDETLIG